MINTQEDNAKFVRYICSVISLKRLIELMLFCEVFEGNNGMTMFLIGYITHISLPIVIPKM